MATWVQSGMLSLARASTHAIALADGRVLVVGNDNICNELGGASADSVGAEVFDPATGSWAATGSLNAPRTDFAALALHDGRVLVTGGLTAEEPAEGVFGAYSSTKLFDPGDGSWSAGGLLNAARTEPAAAVLQDGRVLVAGGAYVDSAGQRVLSSAELYDPDTDSWSPTGAMSTARRGAVAVTLSDGRVLVVGGSSTGRRLNGVYTAVQAAELYDPATGKWSTAGSLASPVRDFSLVALPAGGALVAGGTLFGAEGKWSSVTATAERFDPANRSWSQTGEMVVAASHRSAVVLGNGNVLVAGGISSVVVGSAPAVSSAELYDPASGTWSATASLPEGREGGTFVALPDRSALLVGGDSGYVGEPRKSWCPNALAAAVRYVPGNAAAAPTATGAPATPAEARSNVPRSAAPTLAAKAAAASVNAFGVDLYRNVLADDAQKLATRNVVISPTSIALALAMARAGARGETAAQMDGVLHTSGWDALGPGLNALDRALTSRAASWKDEQGTTHALAIRIANAAFAQRGWEVLQGYLDAIASSFGAGLRLVDYKSDPEAARQLINGWVSKQTDQRIPELLAAGVVKPENRLWLVNAIYLKANWAEEFTPSATTLRAFTRLDGSRISVPTMAMQTRLPYATGTGWQSTELRYNGGPDGYQTPLAMTLILPDNLAAFEQQLTPAGLQAVLGKVEAARAALDKSFGLPCSPVDEMGCCHAYDVSLFMPRFGIESRENLVPNLAALGMPLAVAPAADFTGITSSSPLFISAVIHQANIDVDEKGTTASAATAVGMSTTGGCGPSQPLKVVTLRLDRPFLFILRDVETGAVLFLGRVVDPSAK